MDLRDDLGALFARVTRRLIEAERPILAAHELSMWDYVVLTHLAQAPTGTQRALAEAIRHDKTRLIALLDELERTGLISRERDPSDRRARIVELTPAGRARHAAAQADIWAMEDDLLGDIAPRARDQLLRALRHLATAPSP